MRELCINVYNILRNCKCYLLYSNSNHCKNYFNLKYNNCVKNNCAFQKIICAKVGKCEQKIKHIYFIYYKYRYWFCSCLNYLIKAPIIKYNYVKCYLYCLFILIWSVPVLFVNGNTLSKTFSHLLRIYFIFWESIENLLGAGYVWWVMYCRGHSIHQL